MMERRGRAAERERSDNPISGAIDPQENECAPLGMHVLIWNGVRVRPFPVCPDIRLAGRAALHYP